MKEIDGIKYFCIDEIALALRRELSESFPSKWRGKYYTVMGYQIGTFKRLEEKPRPPIYGNNYLKS